MIRHRRDVLSRSEADELFDLRSCDRECFSLSSATSLAGTGLLYRYP
jgi:hypothetical protein